jgi:hypothetical protein
MNIPIVFIALFTLAGCSIGPPRPSLKEVVAERSPPLMLRIASGDMAMKKQWVPMSESTKEAVEFAAMVTNPAMLLGPGGALFAPLWPPSWGVFFLREGVKSQREKACLQIFASFDESAVQKIAVALGDIPVAQIIEDELRVKLAPQGLEKGIQPIVQASGKWNEGDFQETVRQTNSRTLIIGDIFLLSHWGLYNGHCGVMINFNVLLHAVSADRPTSDLTDQYVSFEGEVTELGEIKKWIEDPEVGRNWMYNALREFSGSIANAYLPR